MNTAVPNMKIPPKSRVQTKASHFMSKVKSKKFPPTLTYHEYDENAMKTSSSFINICTFVNLNSNVNFWSEVIVVSIAST